MKIIKGVQDFPDLPIRSGKRPITIRGPLHVQCGGYGDELSAFAPGNRPAAAPKSSANVPTAGCQGGGSAQECGNRDKNKWL